MSKINPLPGSRRERAMNKKAEAAMIASYNGTGQPGICFQCNPERQVVHVSIHDGHGNGTAVTMDAAPFAELVTKLAGVEIDTLPTHITRTESPEVMARRLARGKASQPMTKGFIERAANGLLKKYRKQNRDGGAS